ncbi:hypothetical protein PCL_06686 [Purpureocillium lilacinum]|uniref:Uncharacterized protein n=1 Tax=Purpureocillium lilacinum TaxID=33203 RepID=A0A2U3DTY3_PURLI|nr:hypothetical protein PCL_06686 [Purpureocillium lilacinum]
MPTSLSLVFSAVCTVQYYEYDGEERTKEQSPAKQAFHGGQRRRGLACAAQRAAQQKRREGPSSLSLPSDALWRRATSFRRRPVLHPGSLQGDYRAAAARDDARPSPPFSEYSAPGGGRPLVRDEATCEPQPDSIQSLATLSARCPAADAPALVAQTPVTPDRPTDGPQSLRESAR